MQDQQFFDPLVTAMAANRQHSDLHIRFLNALLAMLCLFWLSGPALCGSLQPYQGLLQSPALSLEDLGGKRHALADYRGQVILVNFWASWCPPCILEMPDMQRLSQRLAGKPFSILAVNVGESTGTIWKFLGKVKVDFTLLRDSDGQAAGDWEVTTYPTSFLVDGRGELRYFAQGARKWDEPAIVQIIEAMMAEPVIPRE